jgi:hypothetical protein
MEQLNFSISFGWRPLFESFSILFPIAIPFTFYKLEYISFGYSDSRASHSGSDQREMQRRLAGQLCQRATIGSAEGGLSNGFACNATTVSMKGGAEPPARARYARA